MVFDFQTVESNAIGEYLLSLGYNVLSPENGSVALRLCATCKGNIDLILADLILPGRRDLEVAAKVLEILPNARAGGYAV
jgi:CheY-like chemotaxis protein